MNKIFLFVFFLLFSLIGIAQEKVDSFLVNSESSIKMVERDNLGFFYVITKSNMIIKIDSAFNKIGENKYFNNGDIISIDLREPFQVAVFFANQSKIEILDRFIQPLETIEISPELAPMIGSGCRTNDGNFWIYDLSEQKVKKITPQKVLLSTYPMGQVVNYTLNKSILMKEISPYLVIVSKMKSILFFDQFGTFYKSFPFNGIESFTSFRESFYLISNDKLYQLNPAISKIKEVNLQINLKKKKIASMDEVNFYFYDDHQIYKVKK